MTLSRPVFCPDLIRSHSGCDPEYLIRGDGNAFAAKWHQPASYVPVHGASHDMLCFHAGGSTAVRKLENGRQVGMRSKLGSLTYIPSDGTEWHLDGVIEVIHVYLDPRAIRRIAASMGRRDARITPFFSIEDPWLQGFFQMLTGEMEIYRGTSPEADSLLLSQLHHVVIQHLLRWHSDAPRNTTLNGHKDAPPLAPARLHRVIECIRSRFADDLDLAELAGLAYQSEDHFIRSFRAATGMTPYRFLLRERLQRACALLRDSDLPIGEIAAATGFRSPAYFSSRFRHYTGVSPSRYRALQ